MKVFFFFRDNIERREVPHYQPDAVPAVQTRRATATGRETDRG